MIFDVAQRTRQELEPQAEGIVGITSTAGGAATSSGRSGNNANSNGGLGHSVDLPAEVVLAAAERGDHALEETYGQLSGDAGGAEPNDSQCEAALAAAVDACERYYQAFQFVVWAGKNAGEAMEGALLETRGEA